MRFGLLYKETQNDYPWAVNVYGLEHILGGLKIKGWGPEEFCEFLDGRCKLHGKVIANDELEMAGLFLREGSFGSLPLCDASAIYIHPAFAEIFADINEERRGGAKADLSPVGATLYDHNLASSDRGRFVLDVIREKGSIFETPLSAGVPEVGRNKKVPITRKCRKFRGS